MLEGSVLIRFLLVQIRLLQGQCWFWFALFLSSYIPIVWKYKNLNHFLNPECD